MPKENERDVREKNYSWLPLDILSSQDPSVRSVFFLWHANFFPISRRDNGFLDPLDTLVTTAFVTAAAARPETVITRKSCLRLVWRKSVKNKNRNPRERRIGIGKGKYDLYAFWTNRIFLPPTNL